MKKNLVSLLLVGALVAPSALVLAQESEDSGTIEETTQESFEEETTVDPGEDFVETYQSDENDISTLSDTVSEDNSISLFSVTDDTPPSIDELKEEAKIQIDGMNLTTDRKADFKGAINVATSEEEVHSLLEEAKAEEALKNAEDLVVLNERKETAKTKIDNLNTISDTQKANYKGAINEATTVDKVDSIVAQAEAEEDADVKEEYKAEARALIDATKLSDELKANYKGAINVSETKEAIDALVEEAQVKSAEIEAAELQAEKVSALLKLKEFESLEEDELTEFTNRINNAETIDSITAILAEAEAKSAENKAAAELEAKQTEALDELDELELTDEERASFEKQVKEAETIEEVNSILAMARKVSTFNEAETLSESKASGLDLLSSLNLSDDELESFTSGINEAKTVDEVQDVVEAAKIVSGFNNDVTDGLVEKFPELKDKDYTYETVREGNKVKITVKDTEGKVVAVYMYDVTTEEYTEVDVTPGNGDETTVEDDESGAIVDKEETKVIAGQPIQVKNTKSVDSRVNLPETGELGGATAMMAAALSALGGLGLLFKKRK